jgi:hypothetical protein
MNLLRLTLLGLAFALPAAGFAQWQWIDKDGRKVYSDRSPPSDIPANKILKQPAGSKSAAAAAAPAADPASVPAQPTPTANAPKVTGKDKELEDKKKQAQAAEAEKKKAQEEEVAKIRAQNCEQAKRNKASLTSGVRIARTNTKGENEILDDSQRAAEARQMDTVIARECKPAG